jgi:hypothetical protein
MRKDSKVFHTVPLPWLLLPPNLKVSLSHHKPPKDLRAQKNNSKDVDLQAYG